MHLNGESFQCDDMPIKMSHIFQILLKFFHLQSYVATTRMTKMSEKLLPQQGGDISMSLAALAQFTHPTKEWFLTSMPRDPAKFVARL
jgi:hypothetical protein